MKTHVSKGLQKVKVLAIIGRIYVKSPAIMAPDSLCLSLSVSLRLSFSVVIFPVPGISK
jgi:hypothetical protein